MNANRVITAPTSINIGERLLIVEISGDRSVPFGVIEFNAVVNKLIMISGTTMNKAAVTAAIIEALFQLAYLSEKSLITYRHPMSV